MNATRSVMPRQARCPAVGGLLDADALGPLDDEADAAGHSADAPVGAAADADADTDIDASTDVQARPSAPASPAAPADSLRAARATGLAPCDEAHLAGWLLAIAEHDESALTALYDATLSRVWGIVMRVVRSAALAEEVVEDTYFQVWRQALRFDPARGRAMTWLLSMARSRAIDAIRREARFRHEGLEGGDAAALQDHRPAADDLLDVARGHAELHRALMRLQAQPRQLVAMAFFNGMSHEEIASQTALPLGTVKSQIRRALLTLRQVLGDGGPAAWVA